MSMNRPTRSVQIIAILVTLLLAAVAVTAALTGLRGDWPVPESRPTAGHVDLNLELLNPSAGKGAESRACATAPHSPRCLPEGGSGLYMTPGGHALKPAGDSPSEVFLDSEWGEVGPADMPGRVPGRGGWVSEEGESFA